MLKVKSIGDFRPTPTIRPAAFPAPTAVSRLTWGKLPFLLSELDRFGLPDLEEEPCPITVLIAEAVDLAVGDLTADFGSTSGIVC